MLSKIYYTYTKQPATYTKQKNPDLATVWLQSFNHLTKFTSAKMFDFESLFISTLTREQVKYSIYLFVEAGLLERKGLGRATSYVMSRELLKSDTPMQVGLDKLKALKGST